MGKGKQVFHEVGVYVILQKIAQERGVNSDGFLILLVMNPSLNSGVSQHFF
jgi:hypothetical protein